MKNSNTVTIIVKPTANGDMSPWEGGINGVFYRVPRCVSVEVPIELAMLIEQCSDVQHSIESSFCDYRKPTGKRIADLS